MIRVPPSLPHFQRGGGRKWQAKLMIWIGSSGYGLTNAVPPLALPEPAMIPTTIPPRVLDTLRTDVRAGRSCIITYDHPDGTGWLDVFGPEGMRGGPDDGAFTAPIPTVRLWQPGGGTAPLAEAVANRAFPLELDRLAERARPLVRDEYPTLLLLLATIREATTGLRFRGIGSSTRASAGAPRRSGPRTYN